MMTDIEREILRFYEDWLVAPDNPDNYCAFAVRLFELLKADYPDEMHAVTSTVLRGAIKRVTESSE